MKLPLRLPEASAEVPRRFPLKRKNIVSAFTRFRKGSAKVPQGSLKISLQVVLEVPQRCREGSCARAQRFKKFLKSDEDSNFFDFNLITLVDHLLKIKRYDFYPFCCNALIYNVCNKINF